ncbi:unnamed protein product (macronuclear) [Paramecium tetraurelia]|uniref:Chromo domain-containing protein n=1 Tax=Paramecium tetraurelia TaxID=5888 RepID=A0D9S0_PARTE|nr:uncharacterized protein GSPATT00014718001 [Paramecium tetraurelia]CAK79787.1 unnamed protein product [Paramecium tetraurelia]|eukprot:XP_001447184.1 hypothetical protein (macronuclear) [Paramecium tetraurelia strain d4-2]
MSDLESENDPTNRQSDRLREKQKRKYNLMEEENYREEQNGISNERRSARAIKRNYAATMSEEEESMNEPTLESESRRIFVPEIDQILWRKTDQHTGDLQYLVKYKRPKLFPYQSGLMN